MKGHAVIGLLETLAHQYGRNVSLTLVHPKRSWRAELGGVIVQSLVGPEEALIDLSAKLERTEQTTKIDIDCC